MSGASGAGGRAGEGAEVWRQRLPARATAPAKVNLGLFVGPLRDDGRHELATVMQSISLSDELTLSLAPAGVAEDQVLCAAIPGAASENLAWRALRAFREHTGWDAPALSLGIDKSIPLAAGLGGGSADAAAALRLARHVSGLGDESSLLQIAAGLGADVPAQIAPGRWLATGAGESLQQLAGGAGSLALLVLALEHELSTAAVYAQADRLGLARDADALGERLAALQRAWCGGEPPLSGAELAHSDLLDNDLQQAALALCPQIADALARAHEAGADRVLVSGSGPTVIGLFAARAPAAGAPPHDGEALARARAAARLLAGRAPAPVCALAVDGSSGRAVTVSQ